MEELLEPVEEWILRIRSVRLLKAAGMLHAIRVSCRVQMKECQAGVKCSVPARELKLLRFAVCELHHIHGGWDRFPWQAMEEGDIPHTTAHPAAVYAEADVLYQYIKKNVSTLDKP